MGFYFGRKSIKELKTCEDALQIVARQAIQGHMDFSIIEGYRTLKRQEMLFRQGLSKIDGILIKGRHNYEPSRAFDIVPHPSVLNNVSVWKEPERFYILAGVMLTAAKNCGIEIRWGGDWDGDGSTKDQTFHDLGHYELFN